MEGVVDSLEEEIGVELWVGVVVDEEELGVELCVGVVVDEELDAGVWVLDDELVELLEFWFEDELNSTSSSTPSLFKFLASKFLLFDVGISVWEDSSSFSFSFSISLTSLENPLFIEITL